MWTLCTEAVPVFRPRICWLGRGEEEKEMSLVTNVGIVLEHLHKLYPQFSYWMWVIWFNSNYRVHTHFY